MTRDEAVVFLKNHGHKASPRDWILGKTIQVMMGEPLDWFGDVQGYAGICVICPVDYAGDGNGDAPWFISDHSSIHREYPNLKEAVEGAHEFITFITPYLRRK